VKIVKVTEFLNLPEPPQYPYSSPSEYYASTIKAEIPAFGDGYLQRCMDFSPQGQYEFTEGKTPFLGYVSKFIDGKLKNVMVIVERDG
jgi:hypothetical protein